VIVLDQKEGQNQERDISSGIDTSVGQKVGSYVDAGPSRDAEVPVFLHRLAHKYNAETGEKIVDDRD
jgi:hypothetical protein